MTRILSWNVNGIRAMAGKGFLDWLDRESPEILCLQETKAHPDQLAAELLEPRGYQTHWVSAEKKGYSGVATFVKKGLDVRSLCVMGTEDFDREGRVQVVGLDGFTVVNAYFPNSQEAGARIDYKIQFCETMLRFCEERRKAGDQLVICGDFNIAHKPIDLKNPKANEKNPGYLPEERAWMDRWVEAGYVDTFRMFNDQPDQYTWWSYRFKSREKNIGWRIDYHFVNKELKDRVRTAQIHNLVTGSDHCPVEIRLG